MRSRPPPKNILDRLNLRFEGANLALDGTGVAALRSVGFKRLSMFRETLLQAAQ